MSERTALRESILVFARFSWAAWEPRLRWNALITLAFVIVGSAIHATTPLALKWSIDSLSLGDILVAGTAIAVYAVMHAAARASGALMMFSYGRVERRARRATARAVYAHVIDLPHRFHVMRRTGELTQTISDGLGGSRAVIGVMLMGLLPIFVEASIIAGVVMFAYRVEFLLVLLVFAIVYGYVFNRGSMRQREVHRLAARADAEASGVGTDALLNHETVKLFGREDHVVRRIDVALSRGENNWLRYFGMIAKNSLVLAVIYAAALGTTLFLAAREVIAGTMTPGDFVLINVYTLQIISPVERLAQLSREFLQGFAFVERLMGLMSERRESETSPGRERLPSSAPADVRIEGLEFAYETGKPVLRDVDIQIRPGSMVAVVGASGSGKSTLARLVGRLYRPTAGRILIDGIAIDDIERESLRASVATVPQDIVLFNDTIAENIAFARPEAERPEIEAAARAPSFDGVVSRMSKGWDTIVGERGLRLSGGEKQRVAIARAILRRPRLFIFDEATASLDTRTERRIRDELATAIQGATMLVIAHHLSTIVDADEIVVLDGGRVVERGRHRDLLASGGLYAAMWQAQSTAEGDSTAVGARDVDGILPG